MKPRRCVQTVPAKERDEALPDLRVVALQRPDQNLREAVLQGLEDARPDAAGDLAAAHGRSTSARNGDAGMQRIQETIMACANEATT